MVIEIAGIPVEVLCRAPENLEFLRDYASDKPPFVTVQPQDADLRRIHIALNRQENNDPPKRYQTSFLENNAIHELLVAQLAYYDVLLIHGSALCMDGNAYIFTGPSGTGKSTHTRLWRETFGDRVWMINDDKPLLRFQEDDVLVYGTPWNGKHRLGTNASAPLRGIVRLEQEDVNHIEPLSKADAFQDLIRQTFDYTDPAVRLRILALQKRLVDSIPFYHMGCNMQPDAPLVAWEVLRPDSPISHE